MITKIHVFALWIVSVAPLATGETLYLLSGSPTPTSTEHFVSALYAWRQGALSKVRDVMPLSEFILEEPVNRTIVLADLNVKHKRIELIVEDTPDQPFGLDIPLMKDGWFVSRIAILRPSSGEATLALWLLRLGANDLMESDLWGISLNSPDRSLKRLTPELLKHAVATRKSGVVDLGTTDAFSARVQDARRQRLAQPVFQRGIRSD